MKNCISFVFLWKWFDIVNHNSNFFVNKYRCLYIYRTSHVILKIDVHIFRKHRYFSSFAMSIVLIIIGSFLNSWCSSFQETSVELLNSMSIHVRGIFSFFHFDVSRFLQQPFIVWKDVILLLLESIHIAYSNFLYITIIHLLMLGWCSSDSKPKSTFLNQSTISQQTMN